MWPRCNLPIYQLWQRRVVLLTEHFTFVTDLKTSPISLRTDWPRFNCCSQGTLLHFGLQVPVWTFATTAIVLRVVVYCVFYFYPSKEEGGWGWGTTKNAVCSLDCSHNAVTGSKNSMWSPTRLLPPIFFYRKQNRLEKNAAAPLRH